MDVVIAPGTVIRDHRRKAGLTQQQLADAAGLSVGTVRDLEQGLTLRPRDGSVRRITAVLGVPAGELMAPASGTAGILGAPVRSASNGEMNGQVAADLRVRVLGPLAAWGAGAPIPLGPARQRTVLALLALHANTAVHRDSLIEALWPSDPPASAASMLQACVSRIRRLLDPGRPRRRWGGLLGSVGPGYRLKVTGEQLDLIAFLQFTAQAKSCLEAGDPDTACDLYGRALNLWDGEPLADLDLLREHPAVEGLRQRRAAAVIEYAGAASGLGRHDRVLPHLLALTRSAPFNERAHASLMVALAGSGQQAAALDVFDRLRQRLDEQLGVRPGAELAAAQARVLRQEVHPAADFPLLTQQGPPAPAGSIASVPVCQLPPAVADFAGRTAEITELVGVLCPGEAPAGVPVVTISGPPGSGKKALALQVAHQIRHEFPGGQLWMPLGGASPHPKDPADALDELLRALGVDRSAIPGQISERAALCRSLLADRRVLLVAHDTASAAQVRPLLPGTAGSAVIATSRSTLAVTEGAHPLQLGPLAKAEALELMGHIIGEQRVARERAAADQLVSACGLLPLAIRIVAAKLAVRQSWPVSLMLRKLTRERRLLDQLQAGGLSMRASLSLSYRTLSERPARAFRLLGLLGPVDVAEWDIAALLGEPDAGEVVDELTDRSLLTPVGLDAAGEPRYRLHDLIREYAAELAPQGAGPEEELALERARIACQEQPPPAQRLPPTPPRRFSSSAAEHHRPFGR